MAYLTRKPARYPVFLKAFHQFGRLSGKVDTVIDLPDVSRIHAVIEWHDEWHLRDLSKNGVRINGSLIPPNQPWPLKINDQISFSAGLKAPFVVENLDPPKDILVPEDETFTPDEANTPIYLESYHFLPNENTPEVVLFYNPTAREWQCEHVDNGESYQLKDGELLRFSQHMWRLIKGACNDDTETLRYNTQSADELNYIFNISRDEELTELIIKDNRHTINCEARSHHYLTAILARYKAEDLKQQVPEPLQGWRTIDQLTKDIGLSETHINIQIHRARKQLHDLLQSEGMMVPPLIERKRGRVRLAINHYQVIKGSQLEIDYQGCPDAV